MGYIDPYGLTPGAAPAWILHIIHVAEMPAKLGPLAKAGILGGMAGTLANEGITRLMSKIYGRPITLGQSWYETINGRPSWTYGENEGDTPGDSGTNGADPNLPSLPNLPDLNSPAPVDPKTQKQFCEQNPGAPNCQNNEPKNNCD